MFPSVDNGHGAVAKLVVIIIEQIIDKTYSESPSRSLPSRSPPSWSCCSRTDWPPGGMLSAAGPQREREISINVLYGKHFTIYFHICTMPWTVHIRGITVRTSTVFEYCIKYLVQSSNIPVILTWTLLWC